MEASRKKNVGSEAIHDLDCVDMKEVDISQIFDNVHRRKCRHVMILGGVASGKTVTLLKYATECAEVKPNDMVHYVNGAILLYGEQTTAYKLFFAQQLNTDSKTRLTKDQENAGLNWIDQNSDKLIICIDGLQSFARMDAECTGTGIVEPDHPEHLLASVLSGKIWPNARILTTARWPVYWRLNSDLKPDKVIRLDGFNDKSIIAAYSNLLNAEFKTRELLDRCLKTPPYLSLFRHPVCVSFTARAIEEIELNGSASDTSLLLIVLCQLLEANHPNYSQSKDLEKLTYHVIVKHRVVFTPHDLNRIGVNEKLLEGYVELTSYTNDEGKVLSAYVFNHYLLKEIMAVLHVLNHSPDEAGRIVSEIRRESRMEVLEMLLYGTVLDGSVTQRMAKYTEGRKCSIEECRTVLLEQLVAAAVNGCLSDCRLIKILYETGNDVIDDVKSEIRSVSVVPQKWRRQFELMAVLDRCCPLEKLSISHITFDEKCLQFVKNRRHEIGIFQAGIEIPELPTFEDISAVISAIDSCDEIMGVTLSAQDEVKNQLLSQLTERHQVLWNVLGVRNLGSQETALRIFKFLSKLKMESLLLNFTSQLSFDADDLAAFLDDHFPDKLQLKNLVIEDIDLSSARLELYAAILQKMKLDSLKLNDCDLTEGKIFRLALKCRNKKISFKKLIVTDTNPSANAFGVFPRLVRDAACQQITFMDCVITEGMFTGERYKSHIDTGKLRVSFVDCSIEGMAFEEIASSVAAVKCLELEFVRSDFTTYKILSFCRGCLRHGVQLSALLLCSADLCQTGFSYIGVALLETACKRLLIRRCNVTSTKLERFLDAIFRADSETRLLGLVLAEVSIEDSALPELTRTFLALKISHFELKNCGMNVDKLMRLCQSFHYGGVELKSFVLSDKGLSPEGYLTLADCLWTTRCKKLHLKKCDLSREKLDCLTAGIIRHNCSLEMVTLTDRFLAEEGFGDVALIMRSASCHALCLKKCDLTKDKLLRLLQGFHREAWPLDELTIGGDVLGRDSYQLIVQTLGLIRCDALVLRNCKLSREQLVDLQMDGCKKINQLHRLDIIDEKGGDWFDLLPGLLGMVDCGRLGFENCDLDRRKLARLSEGCVNNNVKIPCVCISGDDFFSKDIGLHLATTLKKAQCSEIHFNDCNIDEYRFLEFNVGFRTAKLSKLGIRDDKLNMEKMMAISCIFRDAKCETLALTRCCLTEENMEQMTFNFMDIPIRELIIADPVMETEAYLGLAHVLKSSVCRDLRFLECCLNADKLFAFSEECYIACMRLSELEVTDCFAPKIFQGLASVAIATKLERLVLTNCGIGRESMEAFLTNMSKGKIPLREMKLSNRRFQPGKDAIGAVVTLFCTGAVRAMDILNWELSEAVKRTLRREFEKDSCKVLMSV